MAGSTYVNIQEPASSSATAKLGAHSYTQGSTVVFREEMVLTGTASGDVIQFGTADPSTAINAPIIRALIANSSAAPLWITPTTTVPISGTVTVNALTTGSKVQVEGNVSAIITTAQSIQIEPKTGAVFPISTATPSYVPFGGTSASGGFVAMGTDGGATNATARSLNVNASRELLITGNVAISGNSTAILTTGSKVQVEPISGAVFGISGNASVVVTAQPGMAQINTSGGSTIHLVGGMDGNTSNSTARAIKVNTSQELVITGAVTVAQVTSAVLSNTSGNITTANPLAVLLQNSTATVTVQGNVSAAIAGNTTAVVANSSGVITTANPLAVLLQGSTAIVTIQGNVSAIITTAQKIQVEPISGVVFGISGNATAIISTASKILIDGAAGFVLPVGAQMNNIYQGSTALPYQYAIIAASASGKTAVVASVTGRIVVISCFMTGLTSGSLQWFSSNTAITGESPIDARSGYVLDYSPAGHFRTSTGEALNLSLASTSGVVGGALTYVVAST